MRVLLLGGTGRTGGLMAAELLARGQDVTIAGRRDPGIDGAGFRKVDLRDTSAVRAAIQGMEAVASALASDKGNPVCSGVAQALADQDGLRFVTIAGAGVDAPADNKGSMDKLIGWIMRRVVPEMLADRQRELAILHGSRLRWTMLRPPRLTNSPPAGRYRVTFDRPAGTAISRADLAIAVVDALTDESLIGRAAFVAG